MKRQRLLIVVVVALAAGAYLFVLDPARHWFAPKCVLKMLTGLSCPGCGIQRFVHAFLHGHPLDAIRYNYFLVYSLPYVALLFVGWVLPGYGWSRRLNRLTQHPYAIGAYVTAFMAWFVVRNLLGL